MSISIGPLALANAVVLAPMSGISDAPFRRVAQSYGVGLTVSEMVASRALVDQLRQSRKERRKLLRGKDETGLRAVQLAGCEPELMAEAARHCADEGVDIIDINFGCPAKKVVNQYAGSAIMQDEQLAERILSATVKAVSVPVTLKMRNGWRRDQRNAPTIARVAENAGIKLLTVHGRTRDQGFGGEADWAFVQQVRAATKLPLLINGDITSIAAAHSALAASGADGVMIGRGACGQPWLLGQVAAALAGSAIPAVPSLAQRLEQVLAHYDALLTHYGLHPGLTMARKHLGWYLDELPGGRAWRQPVMTAHEPVVVVSLLREAYGAASALAA